MKNLKDRIFDFITENGAGISFVNLEDIDGIKGDYAMTVKHHIILWHCLSLEAVNALKELISEKKIDCTPTVALTYCIDGHFPNLPIIKSAKNIDKLKKDYWLPVVFSPFSKRT